jgi:hypothetical protein
MIKFTIGLGKRYIINDQSINIEEQIPPFINIVNDRNNAQTIQHFNLNQSLQFTSVANIVGLGILIENVEKVLQGDIESTRFPMEDVPLYTLVTKEITKEQDDEESIPTSDFLKILKIYKEELDKYYKSNPEELKQAIEYYNQGAKNF